MKTIITFNGLYWLTWKEWNGGSHITDYKCIPFIEAWNLICEKNAKVESKTNGNNEVYLKYTIESK